MTVLLGPKRDVVEVCYPNNDNGTGTTPGLSWAWSAWNQITASLASDLILTAIAVYKLISATGSPVTGLIQIQIGTGAAGAETTVAEFTTGIGYTSSNTVETKSMFIGEVLFCNPIRIDAGTRVAVRSSTSSAAAGIGCNVKLYGYPVSSFGQIHRPESVPSLTVTEKAGGSVVQPNAAVTTVATGTPLWTYGAWVQVIASAACELVVTGVATGGTTVSGGFDLEIGTGAAGSEISRSLVPVVGRTFLPGPGWGFWRVARPLYIKPGEAVSVRARGRPVTTNYDICLQTEEINN